MGRLTLVEEGLKIRPACAQVKGGLLLAAAGA